MSTTQRPRTALLAVLLVAVVGALGWFGWQAHASAHNRHVAAADRATEALLAGTRTVKAPLSIDATYTACAGVGDLCLTSSAGLMPTITAVRTQLSDLGISTGGPNCQTDTPSWPHLCMMTGNRDGAKLLVEVGTHSTPYWSAPEWVRVRVLDEGHFRTITSGVNRNAMITAQPLVPAGWQLSPCATGCSRIDVTAPGRSDAALAAFGQKLVSLGYGVDAMPSHSICTTVAGQAPVCRLFASRYYFSSGVEHVVDVGLNLQQTSPTAATGSIFVIGAG